MAQPPTNPKIEELRSRLKADPKNRIFYPLAEELRKVGQFAEAEQVLRAGLAYHPTYLSAWVSLGRVLRDEKNDGAAVEALSKALQLDPGNVVAARLLGDAYIGLGEKVEAIKKYKLVQALLPGDQEIESIVEQLDRELNPPTVAASPIEEESPFAAEPEPSAFDNSAARRSAAETPFAPEPQFGDETAAMKRRREEPPAVEESPFAQEPPAAEPSSAFASEPQPQWQPDATTPENESPFAEERPAEAETSFFAAEPASDHEAEEMPQELPPMPAWASEPAAFTDAGEALKKEFEGEAATGDNEPMTAEHSESPFEEPAAYSSAAFEVEAPAGMHEIRAPLAAEVPAVDLAAPEEPVVTPGSLASPQSDESDVFAPVAESEIVAPASPHETDGDLTNTLTMADLYSKQGLVDDARQIYENILQRDPGNGAVRAKLAALTTAAQHSEVEPEAGDDRVTKLERWLSKVGKREVGSV